MTETYEIKHRHTDATIASVEIECEAGTRASVKLGLAIKAAFGRGASLTVADLRGAYLRDADLRDAYLRDADLRGAYLRGAVLRGADLRGVIWGEAPVIEDIHRLVHAAASQPGALDMRRWHCGTTHCRAGWVVELAGTAGKELESRIGTPAAAYAIYAASDPETFTVEQLPDFYCRNSTALADMKRLADAEAARSAA